MKKICIPFVLVFFTLSAMAEHWVGATSYDYPSSTMLYAELFINGTRTTSATTVEIAAFVDGTCRAASSAMMTSSSSKSYYNLRVWGNSDDDGKVIVFKVYYNGLEYQVTPENAVSFDEESHIPVVLHLDAITGVKLPSRLDITKQLPYDYSLSDDVVLLYQDKDGNDIVRSGKSTLASPLVNNWNNYGTSVFSIVNNVMKIAGEGLNLPLGLTVKGPDYGDGAQFQVQASTTVHTSLPVSFTYPASVRVNRFSSISIELTDVTGIIFDPQNVKFKFSSHCGVPVAVNPSYNKTGNRYYFTVYANMVGKTDYQVYYQDKLMKTVNNTDKGYLTVDGMLTLNSGWNWLSVNSVDNTSKNVNLLESSGSYMSWVQNNIKEIRSSDKTLFNDPEYGMFGDMESLNPVEGMYKVSANSAVTVNTGYDSSTPFTFQKTIRKGYNWFNNPYALDIALSQLDEVFAFSPKAGDRIIGKTDFAEYSGTGWEAASGFVLEAGKGYMYYSNNPSTFTFSFADNVAYVIDASVNTCVHTSTSAGSKVRKAPKRMYWDYDASAFADNMAMVVSVYGLSNVSDYSIGAFVGDECRGEGKVTDNGNIFVNVAGKSGETVSFRLLDKLTGEVSAINETVRYSKGAGSISSPVVLSSDNIATGVDSFSDFDESSVIDIHDLSGRKVNTMTSGVYMITYRHGGQLITVKTKK